MPNVHEFQGNACPSFCLRARMRPVKRLAKTLLKIRFFGLGLAGLAQLGLARLGWADYSGLDSLVWALAWMDPESWTKSSLYRRKLI